jgi:DNA-binding MarR family transcriptional regulator
VRFVGGDDVDEADGEEGDIADEDLVAYWHDLRTGVLRAQHRIDRTLEEAGVPAQWFPVLHLLLQADGHRMPMSVLARDVAMTSGGFTKLADRMAREGLIDRRGSATDRRVVNAALTAEGLVLARRVVDVYVRAVRAEVLRVVAATDLIAVAGVVAHLGAEPPGVTGVGAVHDEAVKPRDPALPERRGRGRERD